MANPPHPGELLDDYLDSLSIAEAARRLGITRAALSRIRHGHASVTADMAIRFSELFGTSAQLWLGMQTAHDLWIAPKQAAAESASASELRMPPAFLPSFLPSTVFNPPEASTFRARRHLRDSSLTPPLSQAIEDNGSVLEMMEAQVWTLIGVFAAAVFGMQAQGPKLALRQAQGPKRASRSPEP